MSGAKGRAAFSMVELLVVMALVGLVFGMAFKGLYGSRQAHDRTERLATTRLARRIHDRLENDVRHLTIMAAPTFNRVSLNLQFRDAKNRQIRYFNRSTSGAVLKDPDEARQAKGVQLVRVVKNGTEEKTTVISSNDILKYVVFRRLGKTLLGVDIKLAAKETTAQKALKQYNLVFHLARHF